MGQEKPYQPSREEVKKAEDLMTEKQKELSEVREESFNAGAKFTKEAKLSGKTKVLNRDEEISLQQSRGRFNSEHISTEERQYHALIENELRDILKENNLDIPDFDKMQHIYDNGKGQVVLQTINSHYIIDFKNPEKSSVGGIPLSKKEVDILNEKYKPELLFKFRKEAVEKVMERMRVSKVKTGDLSL